MDKNEMKFDHGAAELTSKIFDKLQASTNRHNILLSPLSIQIAMAMAFTGAKGKTAEEIASAMRFASHSPEEVGDSFRLVLEKYQDSPWVKIANKIYVQEGNAIKLEYAAVIKDQYQAAAETLDFTKSEAAAHNINAWIESKTAVEINDLISAESLGPDPRLVLLNFMHFKGEWQQKFYEHETREDDFWLNEEQSVKMKFMYIESKFRYGFIKDWDCEGLELPYNDSDLSMLVLLPAKRDGLKNLAKKLKNFNLWDLDKRLENVRDKVVRFPKFKIEYSIELSDVLKEMGITTAFSKRAEFNILETDAHIHISKVFHKSSIEVNEAGTETTIGIGLRMLSLRTSEEFDANRPFLYFIRDKKIILLAGAFVNPTNI
uniref:Serpin domain-containing protein n=1 Tax=Stomoxys calcitrans TaxID=35570 RepID=A0A1I8NTM2_STOCA